MADDLTKGVEAASIGQQDTTYEDVQAVLEGDSVSTKVINDPEFGRYCRSTRNRGNA